MLSPLGCGFNKKVLICSVANSYLFTMQCITREDFKRIMSDADVLLSGHRGPRLLAAQDGSIIKIFPQRKLVTSNRLIPYAKRFVSNSKRLTEKGFLTIQPQPCQRIKGTGTYIVRYPKIGGQDIRACLSGGDMSALLTQILSYVAKLHERGVFFRGIHLGNILQTDSGDFALIDIVAMSFQSQALPVRKRVRNLKHLLNYPEDAEFFATVGFTQLLEAYVSETALNDKQKTLIKKAFL